MNILPKIVNFNRQRVKDTVANAFSNITRLINPGDITKYKYIYWNFYSPEIEVYETYQATLGLDYDWFKIRPEYSERVYHKALIAHLCQSYGERYHLGKEEILQNIDDLYQIFSLH